MAAIISVAGSMVLASAPVAYRRLRRARARRLRGREHTRMISDSLLIVTMRVEAIEEALGELEFLLRHRR